VLVFSTLGFVAFLNVWDSSSYPDNAHKSVIVRHSFPAHTGGDGKNPVVYPSAQGGGRGSGGDGSGNDTNSIVVGEYISNDTLTVLNHPVGHVSRICPRRRRQHDAPPANPAACWLVDPNVRSEYRSCNNNGPMPVRTRSWMHPDLAKREMVVYYSSHGHRSGGHDIEMIVSTDSETGTWVKPKGNDGAGIDLVVTGRKIPCRELHSPSLFVDDENRIMYMYVHGHGCVDDDGNRIRIPYRTDPQPTLVLTSTDGVHWSLPDGIQGGTRDILIKDLFYLTTPVRYNDYYYALAKTRQSSVGNATLCRSKSLIGPWTQGPLLIQGARHADLHIFRNRHFVIFFTLIGDAPEHVEVGTIDLLRDGDGDTDANDWMNWTVLPGPTILRPEYEYERGLDGDASVGTGPSKSGGAECKIEAQLRDPHFLPDDDSMGSDNDNADILSGLLFYVVQGERAFALARLSLNMTQYLEDAVPFRNRGNVEPYVLEAFRLGGANSSLSGGEKDVVLATKSASSSVSDGYVSSLFAAAGISLSEGYALSGDHSSSAEKIGRVLQLVESPLDAINGMVESILCAGAGTNVTEMVTRHESWEDVSDLRYHVVDGDTAEGGGLRASNSEASPAPESDSLYRFALKHWVRYNTLVSLFASWRERQEDVLSDPFYAWRLCMAGGFGVNCYLNRFQRPTNGAAAAAAATASDNSSVAALQRETAKKSWSDLESLGGKERQYVAIARRLAVDYGYEVPSSPLPSSPASGSSSGAPTSASDIGNVAFHCGFAEEPVVAGDNSGSTSTTRRLWDCWLSN